MIPKKVRDIVYLVYIGLSPCPVTITTRIIVFMMFLVGDPNLNPGGQANVYSMFETPRHSLYRGHVIRGFERKHVDIDHFFVSMSTAGGVFGEATGLQKTNAGFFEAEKKAWKGKGKTSTNHQFWSFMLVFSRWWFLAFFLFHPHIGGGDNPNWKNMFFLQTDGRTT